MQHYDYEDHGSIVLIRPFTDAARDWIDENVIYEDWQWQGGALAVEPRFALPLMLGLEEALYAG